MKRHYTSQLLVFLIIVALSFENVHHKRRVHYKRDTDNTPTPSTKILQEGYLKDGTKHEKIQEYGDELPDIPKDDDYGDSNDPRIGQLDEYGNVIVPLDSAGRVLPGFTHYVDPEVIDVNDKNIRDKIRTDPIVEQFPKLPLRLPPPPPVYDYVDSRDTDQTDRRPAPVAPQFEEEKELKYVGPPMGEQQAEQKEDQELTEEDKKEDEQIVKLETELHKGNKTALPDTSEDRQNEDFHLMREMERKERWQNALYERMLKQETQTEEERKILKGMLEDPEVPIYQPDEAHELNTDDLPDEAFEPQEEGARAAPAPNAAPGAPAHGGVFNGKVVHHTPGMNTVGASGALKSLISFIIVLVCIF